MADESTISGGDLTGGGTAPADTSAVTQTAAPSQVSPAGNTGDLTSTGGQPPAAQPNTPPAAPAAPAAPAIPPELQARLDAYERQLQQHQPILQAYHAQQQQAAQAARRQQMEAEQQRASKVFDPMKLAGIDRSLLGLVRRNPQTGEYEALPGAPPTAVSDYAKFSSEYAERQLDFFTNPDKYLTGPIESIAAQVAQRIVDQHLGGFQARQSADAIVESNAHWMFADRDRTQLSPQGQQYQQAMVGLRQQFPQAAPAQVHQMAVNAVIAAEARQQARQQQAGAAGDAAKQQFLAAATAGRTPPGHAAGGVAPPPGANGEQKSLDAQLRDAFRAGGVTDQTLSIR